jgi:hypothetical protein
MGKVRWFLNSFTFKREWFQDKGNKSLRNINIAHGNTKWKYLACLPKIIDETLVSLN